jgi:pre-60S factor REI1
LNSNKHKENERKRAAGVGRRTDSTKNESGAPEGHADSNLASQPATAQQEEEIKESERKEDVVDERLGPSSSNLSLQQQQESSDVEPESDSESISQRIAKSRSQHLPTDCLFCPTKSSTVPSNVSHMSLSHSFFVPDSEYLVDLPGLLSHLGDRLAFDHICLASGCGRAFRSLAAVRAHMVDKAHCKVAYETEQEKLTVSDYYDFTSSYPPKDDDGDEWEDVVDDSEDGSESFDGEMVVVDLDSRSQSDSDSESLPDNQLTIGDTPLELVLPSGERVGHRTTQKRRIPLTLPLNLAPHRLVATSSRSNPHIGATLLRRLLTDKRSAVVPRRGGFGAFGAGTDVVRARNSGEAREAMRHIREFRGQRRREEFRTKVAFKANHQKHFRDARECLFHLCFAHLRPWTDLRTSSAAMILIRL